MPTVGSSGTGVVKVTCSCLRVFKMDLLEAPYERLCRFLVMGLWLWSPSKVGLFLGGGLGWEEKVMVKGLWVLSRGWRR